jgi:hypothetical protein
MTALSADNNLRLLGETKSEMFTVDSAAASQIWKGEALVLNIGAGDTLNVVGAGVLVLADADVFVGIAAESKYTKLGDRETDALIEAYVYPSIIGFPTSTIVGGDTGKVAYMSDTGTVSLANGTFPRIGKIHKVEDGYVYVEIESPKVLDVP